VYEEPSQSTERALEGHVNSEEIIEGRGEGDFGTHDDIVRTLPEYVSYCTSSYRSVHRVVRVEVKERL
jgi:hypothetical protein